MEHLPEMTESASTNTALLNVSQKLKKEHMEMKNIWIGIKI